MATIFLFQPPNGFHGMMCQQKNPVTMGYTAELFPFPSPMSSNTSSPTNMADFNGTLFDDIDRINPTIPPLPPFLLDQQLDHVGLRHPQQQVVIYERDVRYIARASQKRSHRPSRHPLGSVPDIYLTYCYCPLDSQGFPKEGKPAFQTPPWISP